MKLSNKTIVVTGASDGIGKQVALRLAKEHTRLILIARNEARLQETKTEAEKNGAALVAIYPCDIGDIQKLKKIIQKIIFDYPQIDILLNIAGIWQKMMPVEEINEELIDEVIQTNLTGLIHCTRLLLPILKKQKEAAIINVSSKSGIVAQAGQSVYTASKYGVKGFTEVLKVDLKGTAVRVAGVYQSGTNTKMFHKAGDNPPIDKFTNPADLADIIVYMLSRPEKTWIHEIQVEY
jgi:short-subunit dehydrogenase